MSGAIFLLPLYAFIAWTGTLYFTLLYFTLRFVYPGANRQENDVDNSHSYSGEVKNDWSYTSTPSICLHSVDGNTILYSTLLYCLVCLFAMITVNFLYILHTGAA